MLRPNKILARRRFNRILVVAVSCASAVIVSGCREYFDNRDTMTLEVGDAVAVNRATQTIERWPRNSGKDEWLSDGERARSAVDAYRLRRIPDVSATGAQTQSNSSPAAAGGT